MVEIKVNPGVCGFIANLKFNSEDAQMVNVSVQTGCTYVQEFVAALGELDAFIECLGKFGTGTVSEMAHKYCKHSACPVPSAILKGIEVECGLALPKNTEFIVTKT
jgi:hypothetical protein